ncbi:DUF1275 family protein [Actinacidiphila guanduensis]|uniref:Uncharacterized membrane protein YoaK, UPF0700 family n=1 Tax=Actinacidiphila guanduensis TaxID=310781 RepID=A0A1G9VSI0_9ACTN|nr:YoaK family protein [Actinacidiphila guanduensis]SDM74815.1 Uncharacterized membrane protein YoaK, UPF0700 family [Actinacidiphila guanduensis]
MHWTLRQIRALLVPDLAGPQGPLPPLLLTLTLVTGLVDAFSYLALGRVFVANMTGNVVFLAFSLAGASGFSVLASVLALLAFAAGAVLGGRLVVLVARHRARLLLAATVAQVVLMAAAIAVAETVALPATGGARSALIVLLGLAMGLQNAVVRVLAVPDLTTTVLTMTITGVAADSRLAGGSDSKAVRRLVSAAAMFAGALAGAALIEHGHPSVTVPIAAGLAALVALALLPHRRSTAKWTG